MVYIYQQEAWPNFTWDAYALSGLFTRVALAQGKLLGKMSQLGLTQQKEASALALEREISDSSEIEGIALSMAQIRSSVARRLSLKAPVPAQGDARAIGAAEITLDASQNFELPLSEQRLFAWHAALFPSGYSGLEKNRVGNYRDDAAGRMQVVSQRGSRTRIHYEAPEAKILPEEMSRFLAWLNRDHKQPLAAAAIAHLWFLTLHPFEDGNGRIARAITELMLARTEQTSLRFYSLSAQIQKHKKSYYEILEKTQSGLLDITPWIQWFMETLENAIKASGDTTRAVVEKAEFWKNNSERVSDPNQRKILNRLFDGFDGKLTSSKWAKICKCSQDTASRAIHDLIDKKILRQVGAGRSTHYELTSRRP